MSRIRLYGPERGHASWPRVATGMRLGFEACGELASFCCTDDIGHTLDDSLPPGYDAPVGIHVGPPTIASIMQGRGLHRHRLAMIATNSTWVPRAAMAALEREAITGYIGTSPWATRILRENTALPVYTCMHGVSDVFRPRGAPNPRRGYHVLHMASTHNQRKGTRELIGAWSKALRDGPLSPDDCTLRLVCDGPRGFFERAIHEATQGDIRLAETYHLDARMDLSEEDACEYYKRHHLICQPSRAEGFGLCPLEARASGVPTLVTDCTGHECHVRSRPPPYRAAATAPGVIIVPTGDYAPIDDGPGAMAPSLDVNDLAEGLSRAYHLRQSLDIRAREWATWVSETWSWQRVCKTFLAANREDLDV